MSIQWGCHERIGGAYIDPPPVTREEAPDEVDPAEGDPGWVEVHAELLELRAAVERLTQAMEAQR